MATLISWICRVDHSIPDRRDHLPSSTLHDGEWACCLKGGDGDHVWDAIDPVPIEMLRVYRHRSQGTPVAEARMK